MATADQIQLVLEWDTTVSRQLLRPRASNVDHPLVLSSCAVVQTHLPVWVDMLHISLGFELYPSCQGLFCNPQAQGMVVHLPVPKAVGAFEALDINTSVQGQCA